MRVNLAPKRTHLLTGSPPSNANIGYRCDIIDGRETRRFPFNDSKYGDDDLTWLEAIKPYQLFLIFSELVEGMDAKGMNHTTDLGWMMPHNVKDPLDFLQSLMLFLLPMHKHCSKGIGCCTSQ